MMVYFCLYIGQDRCRNPVMQMVRHGAVLRVITRLGGPETRVR